MTLPRQSVPYGFCQCGCGGKTTIAKQTVVKLGYVKGRPVKFISGHHARHIRPESEVVEIDGNTYRTIPLTKGMVAIVDHGDYERLSKQAWCAKINRRSKTVYAARSYTVNGRRITVHMHNEVCPAPSGMVVDHIDRNGLHNWRSNLRVASYAENVWNTERTKKPYGGMRGAFWNETLGRWFSQISFNRKLIHLGYFNTKHEAAAAYRAAIIMRDEIWAARHGKGEP